MSIRPVPGYATPDSLIALEHEHARAYETCETAAQRLELAGHDREAALVRAIRRRLAEHIAAQACPDVVVEGPPCQPSSASPSDDDGSPLSAAEGDALTRRALMLEDELLLEEARDGD